MERTLFTDLLALKHCFELMGLVRRMLLLPTSKHPHGLFRLVLDLRYVPESLLDNVPEPTIKLGLLDLEKKGHKGLSVECDFELVEGQAVTWILRTPPTHKYPEETRPSKVKAEQLGVSFESACHIISCWFGMWVDGS